MPNMQFCNLASPGFALLSIFCQLSINQSILDKTTIHSKHIRELPNNDTTQKRERVPYRISKFIFLSMVFSELLHHQKSRTIVNQGPDGLKLRFHYFKLEIIK